MKLRKYLALAAAFALALSLAGCTAKTNEPAAAETEAAAETDAAAETQAPETEAAAETQAAETEAAAETQAAETEAAQEETAAPEEPAEEDAPLADEVYESPDGWSLRYWPDYVEVQENEGSVSFVYKSDKPEKSAVTVSLISDKQPEEALYEVTESWGDPEAIERRESFFPGTDDKWGFWRTMHAADDGSPERNAVAGEYNGKVLLFEAVQYLTGDEEEDMTASDALAAIMDSLAFKDFGPQEMYNYVPGTYTAEEAEEDGTKTSITLGEDHRGQLHFQDDIDVVWGSYELTAADGSFVYEYSMEGDMLLLNYDGNTLTFVKE